ncbi:MAG: hypothetical protein ACK5WR_06905 [Planctomycetaceae bacterium]
MGLRVKLLLVVLALVTVCTAPRAQAGTDEAREYLSKAQERLAAHDVLVVDNLLRLAEVSLEDVAPDVAAPLRAELDTLRRQYESDTLARQARLLAQRLDRLFEEAELALGSIQTGGASTLRRIDQLLQETSTATAIGTETTERYRKRLVLFRRVHEQKLKERGTLEVEVPLEEDASPTRGARSGRTTELTERDTSGAESESGGAATTVRRRSGETVAPVASETVGRQPTTTPTGDPTGWGSSITPISLFGGTLTNASLFSRLWQLLLLAGAVLVGLVKARAPVLNRFDRLARLREKIETVPMPVWGMVLGLLAAWWLLQGWILFGLLVSLAMGAVALYVGVDAVERVGILGAPAAAAIRNWGLPLLAAALAIGVLHLLIGGAWIVI